MGKIEDSITENYKRALIEGDYEQAKRAVDLARTFKKMLENSNFQDYKVFRDTVNPFTGSFFKPITYSYNHDDGILVILKTVVSLTSVENRFLYLLSRNETHEDIIKVIRREDIKNFVWLGKKVSNNAVRVLVRRIRKKLEPNPRVPQILLNFNRKGYVFVAKEIKY